MSISSKSYRPFRSQQVAIMSRILLRSADEKIVVHHVLEDSFVRLFVQIERQCPIHGIKFERVEV